MGMSPNLMFVSSLDGHDHDGYTSIFTSSLARNGARDRGCELDTESPPRVGVGEGDVAAGAL